jgi:hypothetical protein
MVIINQKCRSLWPELKSMTPQANYFKPWMKHLSLRAIHMHIWSSIVNGRLSYDLQIIPSSAVTSSRALQSIRTLVSNTWDWYKVKLTQWSEELSDEVAASTNENVKHYEDTFWCIATDLKINTPEDIAWGCWNLGPEVVGHRISDDERLRAIAC